MTIGVICTLTKPARGTVPPQSEEVDWSALRGFSNAEVPVMISLIGIWLLILKPGAFAMAASISFYPTDVMAFAFKVTNLWMEGDLRIDTLSNVLPRKRPASLFLVLYSILTTTDGRKQLLKISASTVSL